MELVMAFDMKKIKKNSYVLHLVGRYYMSSKSLRYLRYTVRCRYNGINFLQNYRKKHAIARLLGRVMVCL